MDYIKYIESNVSVMPVLPNSKKAFISDWSKWCERLPIADEYYEWITEKYKSFNIGACMGIPIDNDYMLGCLDIDTDNEETISLCPYSPVSKKGRTGETRFFKFKKDQTTRRLKETLGIEILSRGTFTVLPPSIHPDTKKPYIWLTPDTLLNFNLNDLPIFSEDFIETLPILGINSKTGTPINTEVVLTGTYFSPDGNRCPHGSNARMVKLAHALIGHRVPEELAIQELISKDQDLHRDIQYFNCNERPWKSNDTYLNAKAFYKQVFKSVNQRRKKKGLPEEIPLSETIYNSDVSVNVEKKKYLKLPKLTDNLELVKKIVLKNSYKPDDIYATCASLSLFSVLCSTRYQFAGTRPNTLSLVLAKTGQGKDVIRRMINGVLKSDELIEYNLMGLTSYVSAPALVQGFPDQRTRIDIIDEFSSPVKGANNKNNSHLANIFTEINQIYSIGNGFYGGMKAIGRELDFSCYAPSLTMVGMIQPETFVDIASNEMFSNGFFPRLLYFYSATEAQMNKDMYINGVEDWSEIIHLVKDMFHDLHTIDKSKIVKNQMANIGMIKPDLISLTSSKNVKDFMFDCFQEIDKVAQKSQPVHRSMLVRCNENIKKVAQMLTVSRGSNEVIESDIKTGYDLVLALIDNSVELVKEASSGNIEAKLTERILSKLNREGSMGAKQYIDIFKGYSHLKKQITANLEESGLLIVDRSSRRWKYLKGDHGDYLI